MTKTDTDLIRAVLAGDTEAFGPLVTRYQEVVCRLVLSAVRDFAAAEDITQETFLTAFRRLAQLRDPARFPAWLRRIAQNAARMWARKQQYQQSPADDAEAVEPEAGGGLREEIGRIVDALPPRKRQVAVLCYLYGVPRQDAARLLGVREGTLRKRLHDAKRVLQRAIVEAAELSFAEHLLPKGFADRCMCACKHAANSAKRKEVSPMVSQAKMNQEKRCGCGCIPPGRARSRTEGQVDRRSRRRKVQQKRA
jgi:RNA polymerase sigma-70 factor (ECF subfamily)